MSPGIASFFRRLTGGSPRISGSDVQIGKDVRFGRNVRIRSKRVRIGDGCRIGDDVEIHSSEFTLGDFGTIYDRCFFPGPGRLSIGHNFWLGTGSIIDAQGGTTIGDNVGIGAYSQLWGHMKYGDTLAGCRFHSSRALTIGKDVWLVGHVLVSPVTIGDRALVMLGSMVTKDLAAERTYAGSPAQDVTERFGTQFREIALPERAQELERRIGEFCRQSGAAQASFRVVSDGLRAEPGVTVFDVGSRTYTKLGTGGERKLMRFLLPDAKFTPGQA
jgi:acetyltransferase-like isoleucine patch superfamily enzyme